MKKILLFASLEMLTYSCIEESEWRGAEPEPATLQPLEIVTKSLTPPSLNLSQVFSEGTELGLFVYSTHTKEVYKQREEYANGKAKAVREKGKIGWRKEPEVWLDAEPATLLAYAPYDEKAGRDARHIPVCIARSAARTPSYMYGQPTPGHKKINNLSPLVWLNMKYALSQIAFHIAREKETLGACAISSVRIGSKGGKSLFFNEGWLDLTTGEITGRPAAEAFTRLQLDKPLSLASGDGVLPGIKVFPTLRKDQPTELEALFTIDGKVYSFLFPQDTHWKKGYTYTYELLFNGNSLELEKVRISDWEP